MLSLNRNVAEVGQANIVLNSPSRGELTFTKSLALLGSGFFSITLDADDTALLEDDTYSYELTQGSSYLKTGRIRLIEVDVEGGILDAVLNSLLA